MRCSVRAIAIALAALAAAGCTPELCGRNSDCAHGLVCTNAGLCRPAPIDAGDGSTTDGGTDGATADAAVDGQPIIEAQVR
jgi:hypothetical protein